MILLFPSFSFGAFITVGSDAAGGLGHLGLRSIQYHQELNGVQLLEVDDGELETIGHYIHHEFNRCGGYFYHDSYDKALRSLSNADREFIPSLADYSINQGHLVPSLVDQVDEFQIRNVIIKLSSFENRTYDNQSGVDAAEWLSKHWAKLTEHRSDISVTFFNHEGWLQPSVMATIPGQSEEIIIIGGHLDSIEWNFSGLWKGQKAPGADDNASGIATITEALRILSWNDYIPEKTIIFMAYAAEEVGLRGSQEIARAYSKEGANILGVIQFDMTNYQGSETLINLVGDYTHDAQNTFLGQLIETYLKIPWGHTFCGYGCSDHASWTAEGYPASIPFESQKDDMNSKIHTDDDTLEVSGGHAHHATHFAKLALAYLVELDR